MDALTDAVARAVAEIRAEVGDAVTLVAVTKGFGPEAAQAAVDAGVTDVGENYAQELLAKEAAVPAARWHFMGHVQRNKVAKLAPHVHLWQSVGGEDVGRVIAGHAPAAHVLVQVNLSGLPQRNGCDWDEAAPLVDRLRDVGLDVQGVMGVAGPGDPRPQFRRLRALAVDLDLTVVSMGMSGDYHVAIEEGSTMVRLGTALFGPRPEPGHLRR
ncbi:MAG TPA: YggS family pyridoxal phosphate enzyme [Acidimicrobiales bacterium]|nr:YggS family pyridoxal phosphate enzyme [Acidimicrobiales bacterium]